MFRKLFVNGKLKNIDDKSFLAKLVPYSETLRETIEKYKKQMINSKAGKTV